MSKLNWQLQNNFLIFLNWIYMQILFKFMNYASSPQNINFHWKKNSPGLLRTFSWWLRVFPVFLHCAVYQDWEEQFFSLWATLSSLSGIKILGELPFRSKGGYF